MNTKQSWEEEFEAEFGIHFKNSAGELQFAIAFIKEVEQKAKLEVVEETIERVEGLEITRGSEMVKLGGDVFKRMIRTVLTSLKSKYTV